MTRARVLLISFDAGTEWSQEIAAVLRSDTVDFLVSNHSVGTREPSEAASELEAVSHAAPSDVVIVQMASGVTPVVEYLVRAWPSTPVLLAADAERTPDQLLRPDTRVHYRIAPKWREELLRRRKAKRQHRTS